MHKAAAAGGVTVILLLILKVRAAASAGSPLADPAWDLLRQLTWPGALVAALFSPVGKAAAGWINAATPVPSQSRTAVPLCPAEGQLREIAKVLADVSESVRRSSQVQEQTAATLVQVQQNLAILLDRTSW